MTAMNSIIYRYFLFPFKILMKDSLIETLSLTVACKCNGIAAFNLLIAVLHHYFCKKKW